MHREGLFWLAIAIIVQLLPVIFVSLNLNDVMDLMFQTPAIICSGIGATRMYRKIFDRHAGDLLEYLESSRDATTGEIRFRRHTQLVSRTDLARGWGDPFVTSSALPMAMAMGHHHPRAMNANVNVNGRGHRYVERFQACEIGLEQGHGSAGSSEARMMRIDPDLVL
ncbi:hypothetical protein BJV74DRAFT_867906 [Russula compacta]|nr:hypothetical protein BJV74DRAFT_867906 [Russula compacta]